MIEAVQLCWTLDSLAAHLRRIPHLFLIMLPKSCLPHSVAVVDPVGMWASRGMLSLVDRGIARC